MMRKYRIVEKSLSRNFEANYRALIRLEQEGNFGCWCYFDENLFCQEREGCENCVVRNRPAR
jgi:hypothetical protein